MNLNTRRTEDNRRTRPGQQKENTRRTEGNQPSDKSATQPHLFFLGSFKAHTDKCHFELKSNLLIWLHSDSQHKNN